jgi:plastocyanin
MIGKLSICALAAVLLARGAALAGTAEVEVTDERGHPLADAVVELAASQPVASPSTRALPAESIIDQRHETFLPLVTLIRKGGHVIFTNNDTTMHQVYSFAPIKQFAFEIDEGERSQPVVFDRSGIAAIGCNIHDRMITYVYVAGQPWAALSDKSGHATIEGLPAGDYRGTVWHPQLPLGAAPIFFALTVSGSGARAAVEVPVTAVTAKKPMHMQMY